MPGPAGPAGLAPDGTYPGPRGVQQPGGNYVRQAHTYFEGANSPYEGSIRGLVSGSGSGVSAIFTHLGGVNPTTGTSAAGRAHVGQANATLRRGPGREFKLFVQAIRHDTLSSAAQAFETIIGWVSTYSAAPSDGAYFRWNTAGTLFEAVSRQNHNVTVQALTDPGAVEATYEVVLENAAARFLINGVVVATLTANLPRTTVSLLFAAGVRKTAGTSSRTGPRLTQLAYHITA